MASRQIKMPAKNDSEKEVEEVFSQSKRPERGRYWLQVDRQTKGSYTTLEAAQSAARAIKTSYPIVEVCAYDDWSTGRLVLTDGLPLPGASPRSIMQYEL
jgi:hypothetical protein